MASCGVTVELGSDGKPFEEEEFFLLDQNGTSSRCEVVGDEDIDAFFLD